MTITHKVLLSSVIATVSTLAFFSTALASDRYDYDHYEYDYSYYDNSIDHSFNNYDSYNYTYGYPSARYAYTNNDYNAYYGSGYNNHGYNNDYRRKPTCSITTYRSSGNNPYDGLVTVSWWSSNATSAYLSNVGSVNTSGSQVFSGGQYSAYTLTVSGPGGTTNCSASSPYFDSGSNHHTKYSHGSYGYLASPTFVNPVHSYPYVGSAVYSAAPTTYVTLTQMPYTGFDFGTFGNSLYWLGIIVVALLGAYAIVYSHSGVLPRTFAREVAVAARNQARVMKSLIK